MKESVISDIIKVSRNVSDIEIELSKILNGDIIRWAIIDVGNEYYTISCSYTVSK